MNKLTTVKNFALSLLATCCICTLAPAIPPNPIESQEEYGGGAKQEETPSRTGADPLPAPSADWTKIGGFDSHGYSLMVKGWTIVSLEHAAGDQLDVFIFDAAGNLLDSFDSGCGSFLQLDEPQVITIMVANFHKKGSAYKLIVL